MVHLFYFIYHQSTSGGSTVQTGLVLDNLFGRELVLYILLDKMMIKLIDQMFCLVLQQY